MTHPSGGQHELEIGDLHAVVTEVGATLRQFSAGDQELVWGFGEREMSKWGRGQLLAPWPNRLDEGRYCFAGRDGHVALDEPERHCAIHGMVRWLTWHLEEQASDRVRLSLELNHSPGYPFSLRVEASYRLEGQPAQLAVSVTATNTGDSALPFGLGFHPYLDPGPGGIGEATVSVPAGKRIPLDGRGMPCGAPAAVASSDAVAVAVEGRPIGTAVLDECLTGLASGEDRRWRAVLTPGVQPAAGEALAPIELWADESFGYCEIFTADTLPGDAYRRAVAVEPMTCPPNALRSGRDLIELQPGEHFTGSFGIRPLR